MKSFPDKTPAEIKLCTFDFTDETAAGTSLSAPTVAKSLISGTDTGAALLTVGTPQIEVGTCLVRVLISGGADANKYKLLATVDANNGEKHQLAGSMKVKNAAA